MLLLTRSPLSSSSSSQGKAVLLKLFGGFRALPPCLEMSCGKWLAGLLQPLQQPWLQGKGPCCFPCPNSPVYSSKQGSQWMSWLGCSQPFEVPCLYEQTSGVSQTDTLQLALQRECRVKALLIQPLGCAARDVTIPHLCVCNNMQKLTSLWTVVAAVWTIPHCICAN